MHAPFIWHAATPIILPHDCPRGLSAAAADLARDMQRVFDPAAETPAACGAICIHIDDRLAAETWEMRSTAQRLTIIAADHLGGIYACYALSHTWLGIDPLWYWNDRRPARRQTVAIPAGTTQAPAPRCRWRGLFINDEDLLATWRQPAGQRFGDWPERSTTEHPYHRRLLRYYTPIIASETMEAICETVLRLGGNLLIPASFIDIMHAPEAAIIRLAVDRGLFVSQHHVEPLGVGFFAYQSWHARRGHHCHFDYQREAEQFVSAWQAYAERWYQVAGDQLIWQLGLRGKGDRPAWDGSSITRDRCAALTQAAIDDQWRIITAIDARPQPPCTLTCWLEVSQIMAEHHLELPPGCMVIHCDQYQAPGRAMADSYGLPLAGHPQGSYLHLAVYALGPHLVQGVAPQTIAGLIDQLLADGCDRYTLLNAANIREHAIALRGAFAQLSTTTTDAGSDADHPLLAALFACQHLHEQPYHDGAARRALVDLLATGTSTHLPAPDAARSRDLLSSAATRLDDLAATADQQLDDAGLRWAIGDQAVVLAGLYRALALTLDGRLAAAARALQPAIDRQDSQSGRWRHWYRGDSKIGIRDLVSRLEAASGIG